MKPFTDKISFLRKAISICLLITIAFSNALMLQAGTDRPHVAALTTDLTQLGRQGRLRQTPNFEAEVNRVIEVLANGGNRQPVIVDANGSVQDEIVEQVAIRIARGLVPDSLRTWSLIKLETAKIVPTAGTECDLTSYIESAIENVVAAKGEKILFVEDLPYLVQTANGARLLRLLAASELRIVGGSSAADYDQRIAADPSLDALFERISVEAAAGEIPGNDDDQTSRRAYRGDNVSPD